MDITSQTIRKAKVIISEFGQHKYERVLLFLDNGVVSFIVDNDTDELVIKYENSINVDSLNLTSPKWENAIINRKIISYWNTKNNQGYFDLFVIGLDFFKPSLLIYCIAGDIEVNVLTSDESENRFLKN